MSRQKAFGVRRGGNPGEPGAFFTRGHADDLQRHGLNRVRRLRAFGIRAQVVDGTDTDGVEHLQVRFRQLVEAVRAKDRSPPEELIISGFITAEIP